MTIFNIYTPLEQFEVSPFISTWVSIFGLHNFSITNISIYSSLILFIVIGLHYLGDNKRKLIPSKWSILLESSFESLKSMVREQIGNFNELYLPFIYSLFFFVLIANLISNVPYSFAVTSSAIVCLGLSFTIFIGVTILALSVNGIKFFSFFIPEGTPLALVPLLVLIELVSYIARAGSLGIRLFANIVAGHTLLKILSTFLYKMFSGKFALLTLIPFFIFIGLIGLELAVSFIQSFVLTLLVSSYLKDAIHLH